jgi:uncharacterized membrane protein
MSEHYFLPGGLITIVLASMATYGLRFGGLLLAGILPTRGPARRFLDALPGTILISLVVPAAMQAGIAGIVGISACMSIYWLSRNLLATMAGGVGAVFLIRLFLAL